MAALSDRLISVWNAFRQPSYSFGPSVSYGRGSYTHPDRVYLTRGNERSIVSALYNRISMDVAAINIEHCLVDSNGQYKETKDDDLNRRLNYISNIDQTGREFIQDLVLTMFDEGTAAVIPIDVDVDPKTNSSISIKSWRVGRIREWYPKNVKVEVYNDNTGEREELVWPKDRCAIINNPLYSVMNDTNSTLQRLIRKLNLLDAVDDQSSSGKLDLIIQLPYVIKSPARRQQAEERRKQIEDQLAGSKYGIAYTDGTERITQLNRSIENNLLEQVKYLETKLYGQMGVSENIVNGNANSDEMLNYYNRTLEPILSAICDGLTCAFLTTTAYSQGHRVKFFRDPFSLMPIANLADIADKFTRNEIMSSNEIRAVIGLHKSDDPNADQLRNSNINPVDTETNQSDNSEYEDGISQDEYNDANNEIDDIDSQLNELTRMVQNA